VGETPLYLAVVAENLNLVQLLLQNNANPNCYTDYGYALHAAIGKKMRLLSNTYYWAELM